MNHEQPRRAAGTPGLQYVLMLALFGAAGTACTPTADNNKLPPDVQDPAVLRTPAGALELYRGALSMFAPGLDEVMFKSAILTDELAALPVPPGTVGMYTGLDSRQTLTGAGDPAFTDLHRARAQLREARGFLEAYPPAGATALRGQLYAIEGYADVLLADLFCSGIPLSTVDFNGDYTVAAGSTTAETYARAVALFDSALALTTDSVRLQYLAAVGRGRALLALGRYAEAAAAVNPVPDEYTYRLQLVTGKTNGTWSMFDMLNGQPNYSNAPGFPSVPSREGGNGLDYLSDGDPRVGSALVGSDVLGHDLYVPSKYYPVGPTGTMTLASGVEARLIEAEAALQAGDADRWLAMLNALRTSGGVTGPDTVADTLGVTGCTPTAWCGGGPPDGGPASDDPVMGQPAGGYVPPAGYSYAGSYTIDPVLPAIQQYCIDNSWYTPCWNGHTTVYLYVGPGRTHWNAGTGGVAGLAALEDPGTEQGRVDLLFRERAFWLYMTAHRQGDLRRLIRQYSGLGYTPETVYPSGSYPGANGQYGNGIVLPVPATESELNPKYRGCFNDHA